MLFLFYFFCFSFFFGKFVYSLLWFLNSWIKQKKIKVSFIWAHHEQYFKIKFLKHLNKKNSALFHLFVYGRCTP